MSVDQALSTKRRRTTITPTTSPMMPIQPRALRVRGLMLALLVTSPALLSAQSAFIPDPAIRAILADRVASGRAVGLVVATYEAGQRPKIFSHGSSGPNGVALDANAVFEIGSITKVFTTILLADMVARGEVRLDDPVVKYLPSSVTMPTRGGKEITLLHLATQTSALARMPSNFRPADATNPYADYSVEQMYEFLSGSALTRDIGERYEYSNLGMGLLGHALALRAGMRFEQLLAERVLEPLGLADTRIVLSPHMRARLVTGHGESGDPVANWDLPTLAGAGALRSTAGDMIRFLEANLDSTRSTLHAAIAATHAPRRETGIPNVSIGLGWHILGTSGTPIVWHNGGTGGYRAFVGFDKTRRVGVVVLANSARSADDIALHLLDQRLPLAAPPPPTTARTEVTVSAAVLDTYVGVYELAPGFEIAITREGSVLFGQATAQPKFQLHAESESRFFLKAVDAQITFVKDAGGAVSQLILHQGGRDAPGKKIR